MGLSLQQKVSMFSETAKNIEKTARDLLQEAISTDDLKVAWDVYCTVCEFLPQSWIPDDPLAEHLSSERHMERYSVWTYPEAMDAAVSSFFEPNVDNPEYDTIWEDIEEIMWSVMKSGYGSFQWDW